MDKNMKELNRNVQDMNKHIERGVKETAKEMVI